MRWYLTLGDFDSDEGRILSLEEERGRFVVREVFRHRPPECRRVAGKGFTGGCLAGTDLYVCSFNAVHALGPDQVLRDVLVKDDFNDLHHVAEFDGALWVANTGLDRVDVFGVAGDLRAVPLVGAAKPLGDAGSSDPYYDQPEGLPLHRRRLRDRVHPNHVGRSKGTPIVTCFETRSLHRMEDRHPVVHATPGSPHDGVDADGLFWITCTNGLVVAYEPSADDGWREERRLDLYATTGRSGWCRGLWIGPETMLVGLTRISRAPRVHWTDRPFAESETSVLVVERTTGRLLEAIDLSGWGSHPKLFSIVSAERQP